ncbi:MAG: hypothetical protein KC549_14425 [Myxococcales bacterium]|nr:hypothetical protein [Myxococcales bacterium]MCB9544378.1 hypothetical protein [Myxococcales bacterium]
MDKVFEKSQSLLSEQAEWFTGHGTKVVETLAADSEAVVSAFRTGVETALKHQAELMELSMAQLKKAGEAQLALWREAFNWKAA